MCPFLHTSIFQCSSSFTIAKVIIIPRFSAINGVKFTYAYIIYFVILLSSRTFVIGKFASTKFGKVE